MIQKLIEKLGFLKVKILFTILCLDATILVSFIFFRPKTNKTNNFVRFYLRIWYKGRNMGMGTGCGNTYNLFHKNLGNVYSDPVDPVDRTQDM